MGKFMRIDHSNDELDELKKIRSLEDSIVQSNISKQKLGKENLHFKKVKNDLKTAV
jgi:hypothetical protein